jgi:hypothetical protein
MLMHCRWGRLLRLWRGAQSIPAPGAHPASCTMGIGSLFAGVKWPGRGIYHPAPPSGAEVKE